ncbi:MAG: carbohydrate binding family 9 domain-containing protein [Flavobacteriales bacterium]|nr:carbohydrate binding family 9 domain-containing protein [Flavobacteriales bacterium]
MRKLTILFTIFSMLSINAQTVKKETKALRVEEAPLIDGKLDEEVWKNVPIAKDFVMFEPGDGDPEPDDQKTEFKIIYDNTSIYIGAYLYDSNPNKIMRQLSERDNFGTADFFAVGFNPNNDGQNVYAFFVTSAAIQLDAQISPTNGIDYSWSEVWFSEVSFDEEGWYVEMKIPYSALRFADVEEMIWGLNVHRRIESKQQQYTWNYIDKSVGNATQYDGILTGLKGIDPPTRLSFSPFASYVLDSYDGKTDNNLNFGLDLKYGITDNYTLFATLVPDFSQAGFDNVVLNLGPFEQVFSEQRQFFIEGADLLQKGDLFFSRRIGNSPVGRSDVEDEFDDEEIVDNPQETKVINAVKVTGRSQKGLGIGVLNAITENTYATVQDTITGETSKIKTEPLANYNVFVIDQEFNKNSFISFVNTNVLREGSFRDANVSSLVFRLSNRSNSYRLSGDVSMSNISEDNETERGFASKIKFEKTKGKIRYSLRHRFADDIYDKNDLGFQRSNNYNDFLGNVSYQIFKPTKRFNSLRVRLFAGHFRRFSPNVTTGNYTQIAFNATDRKQLSYGLELGTNIGERVDFFEPRTEGRFWKRNGQFSTEASFTSDFRKRFAFEIELDYRSRYGTDEYSYEIGLGPRFRVNDKLEFAYGFVLDQSFNQPGYVDTLDDEAIIFGVRQNNQIENSFTSKYSFNDKSSISMSFRHYWSTVAYQDQYYELQEDGYLTPHPYQDNNDLNFNSWNLDLRYVWQFTRGSELVALYRNSIQSDDDRSYLSFGENLRDLLEQPNGHLLSIKVIYFLDYNNVKRWMKKSNS